MLNSFVMRAYSVYRFDSGNHSVIEVGTVFELRRDDRGLNRISLTKLARRIFGRGTGDIIFLGEEQALSSRTGMRDTNVECCAG